MHGGGGTTMKAPILLGECILRVVNAFARRYGIASGTETYREVNTIAQGRVGRGYVSSLASLTTRSGGRQWR